MELEWERFEPSTPPFSGEDRQRIFHKILPDRHFNLKTFFSPSKIKIAASIAACVITISFFLFIYNHLSTGSQQIAYTDDAAPGRRAATLTFPNGKQIKLSHQSHTILNAENLLIKETTEGEVIYQSLGNSDDDHLHVLRTRKGETYRITLPDGSKVELNAATILKYPSSFEGKSERIIYLSGEAFFNVTKDIKHPFIVKSVNQEVKVLGTAFNINSYDEKKGVHTVLVDGSINVTTANSNQKIRTLKPGEESIVSTDNIRIINTMSNAAISWKDGEFVFNDESLGNILENVSRWYDLEIIYLDDEMRHKTFGGTISRNSNVSDVLRMLQLTGGVHFKIKGRRIIVTK